MFTKNLTKFEEIEHTADIGILASGDTLPELMANLGPFSNRPDCRMAIGNQLSFNGKSLFIYRY
jgi:hypothetical protein